MNNSFMQGFKNYDEYVVKKGDSLYQIAKLFNTTVADLTDANMLTSSIIYPGQVLLIPREQSLPTTMRDYLTQQGDTIEVIARNNRTTPAVLGAFNDFGKLALEKNQVIRVPEQTNSYQIGEGETVQRILKQTGKSANELIELNSATWLKPGTTIIV